LNIGQTSFRRGGFLFCVVFSFAGTSATPCLASRTLRVPSTPRLVKLPIWLSLIGRKFNVIISRGAARRAPHKGQGEIQHHKYPQPGFHDNVPFLVSKYMLKQPGGTAFPTPHHASFPASLRRAGSRLPGPQAAFLSNKHSFLTVKGSKAPRSGIDAGV